MFIVIVAPVALTDQISQDNRRRDQKDPTGVVQRVEFASRNGRTFIVSVFA